ncbi:MAG TPA: hypothetical protein VGQ06_08765 [Gemmatimonadales bacterium]|jgi:hypothetical protein|nr:hypothetical protein [Gemmatimonadales bacterium]
MVSRRVVQLASLGWGFGVVMLVMQSPLAQRPEFEPPVRSTSDPQALAAAVLRDADRFSSASVGITGVTPPEVLAWQVVARSEQGDSVFRHLLATGSVPTRLYALAGLRLTNPAAYAAGAKRMRIDGGFVSVVRGCIVMDVAVDSVLDEIRDGRWTAEFLAGRSLPDR